VLALLAHFSEISSQIQAALRTATTQAFLARKGAFWSSTFSSISFQKQTAQFVKNIRKLLSEKYQEMTDGCDSRSPTHAAPTLAHTEPQANSICLSVTILKE
jgi:uncharacterized membrane protein YfbV (UPF0208 family)